MPTVDDVGKAAAGLRADTVAWVAALALLAFAAMLLFHLRERAKWEAKLDALNVDRLRLVEDHSTQLIAIYQGKRPPRVSRKALEAQGGHEEGA